jgi:hypothetical protein
MRRAVLGLLSCLWAAPTFADVVAAEFTAPTTRYGHGVLGDAIEYGGLAIKFTDAGNTKNITITLPKDHVFEDIAPRLADMNHDGSPEVIVVETDVRRGAALAIYDQNGKLAETPHIGSSNRWLAPIGMADFNEDGDIDVAYVDRPHLAKILRVWTYRDGALVEIANAKGLSNHRIGDDFISGGVRTCDGVPEMITADATWKRIISTRFENGKLIKTDIGPYKNKRSFKRAMSC